MRENRPIFQKLAPVICKEDDQQDLQDYNAKNCNKREYAMDRPYNIQRVDWNVKQKYSEEVIPSESYTPKKWNLAMKKIKCETLWFYLDRATNLLAKKSNANIRESSNSSSFKEPSFTTLSCEREVSKKYHQRASMKDNKNSILSIPKDQITRKSMVSLTPNHSKGNKSQHERRTLKSFNTTPLKTSNNYYMSKEISNTNMKINNRQLTLTKFDEMEGSVNKDATELKEFIELEDFWRRTTVADSKQSWVDEVQTQKTTKSIKTNCNIVNKNKVTKIKKGSKNLPGLIKTFAITINNDNIIYS